MPTSSPCRGSSCRAPILQGTLGGSAQSRRAARKGARERGQEGASRGERWGKGREPRGREDGLSKHSRSGWESGSALSRGKVGSKRSPDHKGLREDRRISKGLFARSLYEKYN